MKELLLEPLDCLFFRGSLSFDAGETRFLESLFPPSPITMQGIIRSAVLLKYCDHLELFGKNKCNDCDKRTACNIPEIIGSPKNDNYGQLDIWGPFLIKNNIRYYPVPLDLMQEKTNEKRIFALKPSDKSFISDLSNGGLNVRFPAKPKNTDFKSYDNVKRWINENKFKAYLHNNIDFKSKEIFEDSHFFKTEPKVGIEREYDTHRVKQGMLYSINQLRFEDDVKIGLYVDGIPDNLSLNNSPLRVGGEGRVCRIEIRNIISNERFNNTGFKNLNGKKIKLILNQPARFENKWLPNGFKESNEDGFKYWTGDIEGVKLRLISACIGKPLKLGGWDMVKKIVKPLKSYVPASSVYYFEYIDGDLTKLYEKGKIGDNNQIGFGQYCIGSW